MPHDYRDQTARHYAAYRPPLHRSILDRCLPDQHLFGQGLDIGCGTGQSALALAYFCRQVTAIDPSRNMLDRAIPHPRVFYLAFDGSHIPLHNATVDVLTFAGSHFYGKSQALADQVQRVCKPGAWIVVYDFEVLLDAILPKLYIRHSSSEGDYDHRSNFSGLKIPALSKPLCGESSTRLSIPDTELSHFLLSHPPYYEQISQLNPNADPFLFLRDVLLPEVNQADQRFEVKLFYCVYRKRKG